MTLSFDLLEDDWVPCIGLDGVPVDLSLREMLERSHEMRELHGESPLVTVALHRLALAVLHRVFGPASGREWSDLWRARCWDKPALDNYFEQWHDRFGLFHPEKPFYQAPDSRARPKSVASLVHDIASGNNPTLFDHHTETEGISLTPAQAVRMLVAAQTFGLAGLSGMVQKFTDGTCARGVIFLIEGNTLFETLMLNLLRYPTESDSMPHTAADRPAWEMDDPYSPNRSTPLGYLDYLTWQNRRIMLRPEVVDKEVVVREMTMAPALRLAPEVLDSMKHYRIDKKRGPLCLRFREERVLWRDSAALFELGSADQHPPRAFAWLAYLMAEEYLDQPQLCRYLALGMANDKAKVKFYRSEKMPLPMKYLQDPKLVSTLRTSLLLAEETRGQLWAGAKTLAMFLFSPEWDTVAGRKPNSKDVDAMTRHWSVERPYWSRLEIPFRQLVQRLAAGEKSALEDWTMMLRKTAWESLEKAMMGLGGDPVSLKASVRAREKLGAGLSKVLPNLAGEKEA